MLTTIDMNVSIVLSLSAVLNKLFCPLKVKSLSERKFRSLCLFSLLLHINRLIYIVKRCEMKRKGFVSCLETLEHFTAYSDIMHGLGQLSRD